MRCAALLLLALPAAAEEDALSPEQVQKAVANGVT